MIKYYWDSCVFIDRIQRTPDRIGDLEEITNAAEAKKVLIVTSAMAIAEVCKLRDSTDPIGQQAESIRAYFDNDFIAIYQVTQHIAEKAAEFVRSGKLKPPDAIHVATAIHANVFEMHTFDGVDKPKGLLKCNGHFGTPALRIVVPKLAAEAKSLFTGQ